MLSTRILQKSVLLIKNVNESSNIVISNLPDTQKHEVLTTIRPSESKYFNSTNSTLQLLLPKGTMKNKSSDEIRLSYTLGDHMEDLEFLPLQSWQIHTIRSLQRSVIQDVATIHVGKPKKWKKKRKQRDSPICVPPAKHISTDFCCGGTTQKIIRSDPNQQLHHRNDPWTCANMTLEDYERVRRIALQSYIIPLPNKTKVNGYKSKNRIFAVRCDVCRIVQLLKEQKLYLKFWGDSIMHQLVYGWICALQQRNYNVTISKIPEDSTSFHIHVTSPEWSMKSDHYSDNDPMKNGVTMTYYSSISFGDSLSSWDSLRNVDVLILNHGLHWAVNSRNMQKSPEYYKQQWNATLHYWSHLKRQSSMGKNYQEQPNNTRQRRYSFPRLVAIRETSSQHFDSDSGEYNLRSDTSSRCIAHRSTTYLGWREAIVKELALQQGYRVISMTPKDFVTYRESEQAQNNHGNRNDDTMELIWLPFLNFTSQLHFLHPSNRKKRKRSTHDCTHFCQIPSLWWPMWRSLRLAMDRKFS